ncbi:tyrosine-type recombinase/integrase [Vreelandella titanicae]|uniref:tyrosine-type recombinase/integrase n=1 Tax=Vreelandella titanicae TaxID=664683 RepID=UPI003BF4F13B
MLWDLSYLKHTIFYITLQFLPKGQRTRVLRHTFASHFVINGGNLLTLQKIMGHQSIQMTMRYAHLAPDHLKETVTFGPKIFG